MVVRHVRRIIADRWPPGERGAVFLPVIAVIGVLGVLGTMLTRLVLATGDPSVIGPALSGGGAAIAVSIAGWIARKILAGEVVPLPIKQLLDTQQKQVDTLQRLVEGSEASKVELLKTLRDATDALAVKTYADRPASRSIPLGDQHGNV